jgi:hypothetical protein
MKKLEHQIRYSTNLILANIFGLAYLINNEPIIFIFSAILLLLSLVGIVRWLIIKE